MEEAERVVEREREEAGGGGEEDEAASGEGVGEEAGRNELGVDLEEVAFSLSSIASVFFFFLLLPPRPPIPFPPKP